MKVRKITAKLIKELKDLQGNRTEMQHSAIDFISNTYRRNEPIEFLRRNFNPTDSGEIETSEVFQTSVGLYISSLVTCWETLFRDLFIHVINNDRDIYDRTCSYLKSEQLETLNSAEISESEFMSKSFNFQDLSDTCKAFNFLFKRKEDKITDYFNDVGDERFNFSSPNYILIWLGKNTYFAKEEIFNNLEKAFEIRHKVIHDANFRSYLSWEEINKLEDCLMIFPQFIINWLAVKYNQNRLLANNNNVFQMKSTDVPIEGWSAKIWGKCDFYNVEYEVLEDEK